MPIPDMLFVVVSVLVEIGVETVIDVFQFALRLSCHSTTVFELRDQVRGGSLLGDPEEVSRPIVAIFSPSDSATNLLAVEFPLFVYFKLCKESVDLRLWLRLAVSSDARTSDGRLIDYVASSKLRAIVHVRDCSGDGVSVWGP